MFSNTTQREPKLIVVSKILGLKEMCASVKNEFEVCKPSHVLFGKFHEEDKLQFEL